MRFPLAPMDLLNKAVTWVILPLPLLFLWPALYEPAAIMVTAPVGLILVLVYGIIWLWMRPRCFELRPDGLRIVWPLRSEVVPWDQLEGAEQLTRPELKQRFGYLMRVGAGGLGGGFGLAMSRKATLRLYVSRVDSFVLVRARQGRSLLLTPEDGERFVQQVEWRLGQQPQPSADSR